MLLEPHIITETQTACLDSGSNGRRHLTRNDTSSQNTILWLKDDKIIEFKMSFFLNKNVTQNMVIWLQFLYDEHVFCKPRCLHSIVRLVKIQKLWTTANLYFCILFKNLKQYVLLCFVTGFQLRWVRLVSIQLITA